MVSQQQVLDAEWRLLRIELVESDAQLIESEWDALSDEDRAAFLEDEDPEITKDEWAGLTAAERAGLTKGERERLTGAERERLIKGERERLTKGERERLTKGERERLTKGERERLTKGERDENLVFDGYARFWSKVAVLGVYWIAEKIDDSSIRIQMIDDIELEGFKAPLSFVPDSGFKQELLSRCNWEEVVRQIFPDETSGQLSLFDGVKDE